MRLATVLILAGWAAAAQAEPTLCLAGESVLFSCRIASKLLSVCAVDAKNQALHYRYGKPGRPELVYPERNARGAFYQSSSTLIGGGEMRIDFDRGSVNYVVFSRVRRSEPDDEGRREPVFEDGLRVTKSGKPMIDKLCDDGGAGFRGPVNLPTRAPH